jgi:pimeloyl-ACP methyl ester carboxylesterase
VKQLILISAVIASALTVRAAEGEIVTCRRTAIAVALTPGAPALYTVSGELCATPTERTAGKTVQVLIHGASYNYEYWDFGRIDGVDYSYARQVAARGIPTFAFDQLGSGSSSRPPSELLSIQAAAYVAHQIVQGLRSGAVAGVQFGKVITVGHSLGSVVVWEEAISYADVDGLIVTGAAHSLSVQFGQVPSFYPAAGDPTFTGMGLDAGYLTTIPNVRANLFYNAPDDDPEVVASDEARKDLVSGTELSTGLPIVTSTATRAIQVPVLSILGNHDLTTCGASTTGGSFDCSSPAAVVAQETPFYSAGVRIHACVVPGSGHSVSLARNHRLQVEDAVAWSIALVGQTSMVASGNELPPNCR